MLNKFLITAVVGCAVVVVALDASNDKLRTDYQAAALRSQSQNTVQAVRPASTQDTANPSITPPTSNPSQLSTPNAGTVTTEGKAAVNRELNPNVTTTTEGKASVNRVQINHTLSIYTGYLYKSDVITLQKFLIAQGYLAGTADGRFGSRTRKAVMEFQKDNGISQTGNVGPLTLKKINSILTIDLGQKGLVN
jgi:murein L,D-transpeptidase YcbB/YkuD